jgi:anti-sigma B factor antagonist
MQVDERNGVLTIAVVDDQCSGLWKLVEPYVAAGKKRLVIDLSGVGFLNSVSIAAIINVRNKLSAVGGTVVVANLRDSIRSVFRILKIDRLFDLSLDTAGALKAVG